GLRQLGIEYIPSYGNFLSFRVRGNIKAVNESLLKQGVIVRPIGIYEMPEHLRVTVGLESENLRFLKSLEMALDAAQDVVPEAASATLLKTTREAAAAIETGGSA
ncbi:MAG: aminotransferase class I/II-fold pyridoxal phosphate-dependent enzyme, partial [Nitrosospira sp.]